MGHQWFGDTVTCKDWGQIWLNESFATFMQMSYFEHSRGTYAYQREIEDNSQQYFAESRRYKRPLVTNFYANPEVMFDEHTYPKGGVLLHSLRRFLGDEAFYAGLHEYLVKNEHTPVDTSQLEEALIAASGINVQPWFDQWIFKPGHPVIDWSWTWDDAKKAVVVHVKQTQDTKDGTPIYDVPATVGLVKGGVDRRPIHLNMADQQFELAVDSKPDAVIFDPDHDFLRDIPVQPWTAAELPAVLKYAPNCIDRTLAMNRMLEGTPSDENVRDVVAALTADQGPFPAFVDVNTLRDLGRPDLQAFFESELKHQSYERRTAAAVALGNLNTPATNAELRGLINDSEPYSVVSAAIVALGKNDYAASEALIKAQAQSSNRDIRTAVLRAMVAAKDPAALDAILASTSVNEPDSVRAAGYQALLGYEGDDPRIVDAVRAGLTDFNFRIGRTVLQIAAKRKMKEVLPDLDRLEKTSRFLVNFIEEFKREINAP
jgi:aminopeptidase N